MRQYKLTVSILGALAAVLATMAVGVATTANTGDASSEEIPAWSQTVGVRFVHDGDPVVVHLTQPFGFVSADNVNCGLGTITAFVYSEGFSTDWPMAGSLQPNECKKGPPTTIRVEFLASGAEGFERLLAEFVWEGCDIIYELEVDESLITNADPDVRVESVDPSSCATNTPTATPVPSEAPTELPSTGSTDERPWSSALLLGLALLSVAALLIVAGRGARPA